MTLRRKQQLLYLIADLISSELVWLCFLIFRWMVYDGRVDYMRDALIPAFSFWLPLLVYPLICLMVYYLSGYYLRPFQKPLWREFLRTLGSAAVISLFFFFIIIIRMINSFRCHYYYFSFIIINCFVFQYLICLVPLTCKYNNIIVLCNF